MRLMSTSSPKLDDLRIERSAKPVSSARGGWWIFTAVILVSAGLSVWWLMRPKPFVVHTAAAREMTAASGGERTVLNASGYVTARRWATVSSKVTGKVTENLAEEGVRVKEGEILARLDDTNVKASLMLARAQVEAVEGAMEETRVRSTEAEQELQRQAALKKGNVSAEADYQHAEAASLAFRARLMQQQRELVVAQRTVAIWEQQVEDTIIRAPFAGVVTSKNAQPGEMISPMSSGGFTRTGICTIVDMDSLEIEIDVNESYLNRVTPGQAIEATLDAYPDWKIACKVIAIIPTADRQKSTVRVRVGFTQLDPRILPEMAVKVAFRETNADASSTRAAMIVPKSALRNEEGRDVVFVVQNARAERRAVSVESTEGDQTVLKAGLTNGEKVIVDAPVGLVDGSPVKEK